MARKNAKSTLTSGIALYCLTCEGEKGPQVKTAATTGDQARIVFDVARAMVEKTPDLIDEFLLRPLKNSIECMTNDGTIKPINSKASTQDGLNPHCTIIDELHAHESRKLFDVLKSARGARKNPLSWYITTAGYNVVGVCYEQRTIVTRILEGKDEMDHYYGIIYALDVKEPNNKKSKDDDPFDERNWIKANPNLDISVNLDELRAYAEEAKVSQASQGEFMTKRCNLWLQAGYTWLNMRLWGLCANPSLKLEDFYGQECWIGADLADKNDSVALVLLFKKADKYVIFPFFYLPKDIVQAAADRTTPHYLEWAKTSTLTLTEGNTTNYAKIEEDIVKWGEKFAIKAIVFDQFGSGQISSNLNEEGYESIIMYKSAKTFTDPCKELESMYEVGRIEHPNNPMLNWMVGNATIELRVDGSILPKKESKNSANKIDGVDAIINAISQAMYENPEGSLDDFLSAPISTARIEHK